MLQPIFVTTPSTLPHRLAMTSRIIVKNLPAHANEVRLRELFTAVGEVTDCRIKQTKGGKTRNFGFVGFRTEAEAAEAVKKMHKSFFDTARMQVEVALPPGSTELGRPWSRYAPGSAAHSRNNPSEMSPEAKEKMQHWLDKAEQLKQARAGIKGKPEAKGKTDGESVAMPAGDATAQKAPTRTPVVAGVARKAHSRAPKAIEGARKVKTAAVKPNKAGVGVNRVHVEFASSGEEDEKEAAAAAARREEEKRRLPTASVAFDEEMDDLSYLKAKSKKCSSSLTEAEPQLDEASAQDEAGAGKVRKLKVKKMKRKKRLAREEAEAEADNSAPGADVAGQDSALPEDVREEPPASPKHGPDERTEPVEASERLYVTNLPYGTTEDELRTHFESQGEVESVFVCKDEDTLKSRGFGYVAYVFLESAVKAQAVLDLQPFQGRVLHLAPAQARPDAPAQPDKEKLGYGSTYKRKLAERRRKVDAHLEHTWNLLYVSASAATDAASAQLGVQKSELLGRDAENTALIAALAETSVIQQTKQWLQREGIRVDAFEQSGPSLAKSKATSSDGDGKRREDTFIVKHLPAGASVEELRDRFTRFGEVTRCSLAPSGTVAIIQYVDKAPAQRAFQKLAFSRYRHVPLYLEWAPEDVFIEKPAGQDKQEGASAAPGQTSASAKGTTDAGLDDDDDASRGCLFIKNLNFATTDATLKSVFSGCGGFRSAVITKKKASIGTKVPAGKQEPQTLSMGFGFVEFDSTADAREALKSKQGIQVENHALQLQVSNRGSARQGGQERRSVAQTQKLKGAVNTQRLCVRNLAFEATRKDLHRLFSAYGSVTAVRLPKKADYSGHRGFAFVDFASKSETAAAYEALQHTHLYGRRFVIELAEEVATDVGTVQQAAEKRQAMEGLKSEAKKRKRVGILNAPQQAGDKLSFEAAFT